MTEQHIKYDLRADLNIFTMSELAHSKGAPDQLIVEKRRSLTGESYSVGLVAVWGAERAVLALKAAYHSEHARVAKEIEDSLAEELQDRSLADLWTELGEHARSKVLAHYRQQLARHGLEVYPAAEVEEEWGVKFPAGNTQSYGTNKAEARRFAVATTALRPDLPTLVVRKVRHLVRDWETPA